jgi:hypothetical protein
MKRSTLILFGMLVLLIAIAWVVMNRPGEQSAETTAQGSLVQVDSIAIDRISIATQTETVILERRGTEWQLTSPVAYRADQTAVADMIHQAKQLTIKSVVSNRPEKQNLFRVDSTGTVVRFFAAGKELAGFIAGKMGGTYRETYARNLSTNDVVLVDGAPGMSFSKAEKDWRDKSILTLNVASITAITFQYGDTTFALNRPDSVWMIGTAQAKAEVAQALVNALAAFRADDFMDVMEKTPKVTAQITVGGEQVRFAYSKEAGKYFVQHSRSAQWFVVESWNAANVLKRKRELL